MVEAITNPDAPIEPLSAQLMEVDARIARNLPDLSEEYDRFVSRVRATLDEEIFIQVGDRFPRFILPNETGGLTSLDELLAKGPVIVSFNRGHWCPYCERELKSYEALVQAGKLDPENFVSVIPETQKYAKALRDKIDLTSALLMDVDLGLALQLGLVVSVGPKLDQLLRDIGIVLETYQNGQTWLLPIPATFVVDREGIVRRRFIDPDFRIRSEPALMARHLQDLSAIPVSD